jgi:pimeloyl-ACP methyl ester carboxylesterase
MWSEDTGGEGPPILLHRSDGEAFDEQVAGLRDVYRVLTLEAPSARSDGTWAVASFEFMDRLGIERAVLGGRGAGAESCLRAGLRHPDRVRALILLDPPDLDDAELADRLDELAMPVLLVHGAEDPSTAARTAAAICDAASDCRGIVAVPGAGQAAHLNHPEVVNAALRSFLEGLPA